MHPTFPILPKAHRQTLLRRHHQLRIQALFVPVHAPVQVRAGDPAGGADRGDQVALFNLLALLTSTVSRWMKVEEMPWP